MSTKFEYKLDKIAKQVIVKAKLENVPATCRCGETPSGTKHIGTLNDNLRSYFIYRIIKKEGYPAKHIQTHDDMDPLRKSPRRAMNLNRKWYILTEKEKGNLAGYTGRPLCYVPDIFGCCKNWAEHFEKIWEKECAEVGLTETKFFSTGALYNTGKFDPYIKIVFEKIKIAREIILNVEKSKPSDYFPIWAICEKCKKWTGRITRFDLENETVDYICTNRNLTAKYTARGCRHEGTVDWKNGRTRLDWEFEWPAQMLMFQTTLEPFGKDHYIGSWPLCQEIIKKVYDGNIPLSFYYEFFLMDGKKMATRHGNVYTINEVLKIIEPEALRFLYTKRPEKQRNFDLSHIFRLVDEFDKAERVYFGLDKARNIKEEIKLKRGYELAMLGQTPKKIRKKINYLTAASIVQTHKKDDWERVAKEFVTVVDDEAKNRLILAKNWIDNFAADEFKIKILSKTPSLKRKLIKKDKLILKEFSQFFLQERTEKEIWNEIKRLAMKHGLSLRNFCKLIYLILFGKEYGPKLSSFLPTLEKRIIIERFNLKA